MRWVLLKAIRLTFANVFATGTKHKFRRFGTGIYSTACSSSKSDPFYPAVRLLTPSTEADDYMLNGDESSKYRVLLVSRVVVGNPHKRRLNATNLIEPPCGHHSVRLFCPCWCYQASILTSPGRWRTWNGPQLRRDSCVRQWRYKACLPHCIWGCSSENQVQAAIPGISFV